MFGIFSRPRFGTLFRGFVDHHCHLLPGVDDGVRTMDESLRILERYESLGVKEVWLTPHVMEDVPNTTEGLRQRFEELQRAYTGSIRMKVAAEYMMDNLFKDRLMADDLLPLGGRQQHLLVETSYFNPPIDLMTIIDKIKSRGYYPVLAHPERYVYMDNAYYGSLKEQGVKFQLNLFSLAGAYGREAAQKATYLLRAGMYDIAGTDTHSYEFFVMSEEKSCRQVGEVEKLMGENNRWMVGE